jgi:hypothetical protein
MEDQRTLCEKEDDSATDRAALRRLVQEIIGGIIPEDGRLQEEARSRSRRRLCNPILPILIDGRVDDGNMPSSAYIPNDARE